MTEKALMKELSKYPTIEEIEKEYKEWAVNLLKVRFDLKPEAFDPHHAINYSFENCADGLWNNIKGSIEECLWLQKERIRLENQLSEMEEQRDRQAYITEDLIQEKHKWTEQAGKEMAKEFFEAVQSKCKELENKYSHLCKSKKEAMQETCRYEGVLAVKRELYEIAKQFGVEE